MSLAWLCAGVPVEAAGKYLFSRQKVFCASARCFLQAVHYIL